MLRMLCKYAEMVNGQLGNLLYRVTLAETALQANPQLLEGYNEAVRHTQRPTLPGLLRQLEAFQQEVEGIPG
jgi:hypothetical protein